MTAMVRIVVEEVADALRIPNAALRYVPPGPMEEALAEGIQTGEGRVLVWRLGADGSAEPVAVLTGASDDRHTELMEGGLTAGDRLITAHGAGD
jgi:HlyD family secretion protein